jgi:L-fucose isomerase-like protein
VAHASAVRLRGRRVGIVGDPPAGFEPCEGDADELRASTGIVVQRVPLADLFAAAGRVDSTTLARDERRVAGELDLDPDVATAGLDRSIALLGGLRELCDEHEWSALATRCWPECMADFGGAVCTPMAMLTEDGVPSVCEADLHGAVTALVLRHVSGGDPFVADLVDADVDDGTSVVWHCGVAATTLADPRRRPAGVLHPNRHVALVNQFALRPGRVTVARLSRAGGSLRLVVGGGEVLARPRPFQGTCGVLRWDRPVADVLATVFAHGLEHHLGIVYGDHRDALVALAAEWGMPVLHLGDDAGAGPGPV